VKLPIFCTATPSAEERSLSLVEDAGHSRHLHKEWRRHHIDIVADRVVPPLGESRVSLMLLHPVFSPVSKSRSERFGVMGGWRAW
jgi:hypothetical protein